ncbi:hypothetical protein BOTBODRAFT_69609 [Botryobasidium botryosum FD-172 SS1]|uniref:RRM domain-containing protein n=1 Tax=Botryobasidium botryosum (strain FD-172 SS1) TaxID=930990 RepID=A0A067MAG0_BOTB1|nr:hypothetical protein BOTBODRAFT_69609 [Botryobasidium botryosum FD-172 SS1]
MSGETPTDEPGDLAEEYIRSMTYCDAHIIAERARDAERAAKILKKVEFWLSDSFLPYNEGMWRLYAAHPDHWIPISALVPILKRRRCLIFDVKETVAWVADALRKSEGLLEVDENGENVRRSGGIMRSEEPFCRSVYAKGFGQETGGLHARIQAFFSQYGDVVAVKMRRTKHKQFKGSVFCEFKRSETTDAFLESEPAPAWDGEPLLIMYKQAYCQGKYEEIAKARGDAGTVKYAPQQALGRRAFNAFRTTKSAKRKAPDEEPDWQEALKQVELYFSDINLLFDPQMWILHSNRSDNWVPIASIADLKEMRVFRPFGLDWIVNAIRKSESLLEVDTQGRKVRRKTEVPRLESHSVYVKGFGEEGDKTQADLEGFFSQYGEVVSVKMHREIDGKFDGSVTCRFDSQDAVDTFLAADPPPAWSETELDISHGLHAQEPEAAPQGRRRYVRFGNEKMLLKEDGTVDPEDIHWAKGCTLKFTGVGPGHFSWLDIKKPLKIYFRRIPYVKMSNSSQRQGIIGFKRALTEYDIEKVRTLVPVLAKGTVEWTRPSEEEERDFVTARVRELAVKAHQGPLEMRRRRPDAYINGKRIRGGRAAREMSKRTGSSVWEVSLDDPFGSEDDGWGIFVGNTTERDGVLDTEVEDPAP